MAKQEKFIHVKGTGNIKESDLDRWECPICRENKEPECRFNLKQSKRYMIWPCRFCGSKLLLDPEKKRK